MLRTPSRRDSKPSPSTTWSCSTPIRGTGRRASISGQGTRTHESLADAPVRIQLAEIHHEPLLGFLCRDRGVSAGHRPPSAGQAGHPVRGVWGWDAAGAKSFGYPTIWINRFDQPVEELAATSPLASPDRRSGPPNGDRKAPEQQSRLLGGKLPELQIMLVASPRNPNSFGQSNASAAHGSSSRTSHAARSSAATIRSTS